MSTKRSYVAAACDVEVAARNGQLFEDPHLLLIGQSGVGKSSLAGFLIDEESRGVAGPEAGTREPLVTTPVQRDGVTFHVHDTVGLGDPTVDTDALKDSIRRHVPIEKCLVLLCVRFDARLVDHASQLVFDVCHSLSPNIWKKAIVALTHSDRLPPEIKEKHGQEKREAIEEAKATWKQNIQQKLRQLELRQEDVDQVSVCFTSHTSETNRVDRSWTNTLNAELASRGFHFLVGSILRYLPTSQNTSELEESLPESYVSSTSETFESSTSSLEVLRVPSSTSHQVPSSTSHQVPFSTSHQVPFSTSWQVPSTTPQGVPLTRNALQVANRFAGFRNILLPIVRYIVQDSEDTNARQEGQGDLFNRIVNLIVANIRRGKAIGEIIGMLTGNEDVRMIAVAAGIAVGGGIGVGISLCLICLHMIQES